MKVKLKKDQGLADLRPETDLLTLYPRKLPGILETQEIPSSD